MNHQISITTGFSGDEYRIVVLKAINCIQFDEYKRLVKKNPNLARFARGWMRRVQL
jgi:hypothetical protein